ncbi:hypothetical protein M426DRAFT_318576 [Hypoxylon sp. CI-4A]|nr:hypothetical protein M426DRAFT_318576 [Hypoxylon sp. CI-4A]
MAATDPRNKQSLFDDSEDESDGGVKLQINTEYAKRFEHNKKREEMHRLEEKYKKSKHANGDKSRDNDESDSSSDEDEDDNGFLATEDLDAQISATLQAIKTKDPRLYDGKTTFYKPMDESAATEDTGTAQKKEKPIYLQDYHREKILRGDTGADFDDVVAPPRTYAQEQDDLKRSIKDEIQAQLRAENVAEDSESDEDFMKAKEETRSISEPATGVHPSRAGKIKATKPDIKEADKDPELFLSNFMASRAWVEEDGNGWEAFESDQGEDDKADEWEAAYNLRFEDPSKSNEVLKSYSRDVVAARSVRREDKNARKRQREIEREQKEEERQKRKEERARLRRLKLDEAEGKLKKIKQAAGLSGKTLKDDDWQKLLEDSWENDKWEEHLRKTFDDQYYAAAEEVVSDEDEDDEGGAKKSKKAKKPKWDDDIDIKDLVPDFEDEERPNVTLTDDERNAEENEDEDEDEEEEAPSAKRQKTSKERKREKLESQKAVRQERAKLEAFVDAKMNIDDPEILASGSNKKSGFAYRETRPESFGLTTRDILMASDADLNEYAGLKKLAHFRPGDKQSKDRKRLGKKARLRQWRKETFGPEFEREPPAFHPGGSMQKETEADVAESSNIIEGGSKKKRKRSRGKKGAAKEEAD